MSNNLVGLRKVEDRNSDYCVVLEADTRACYAYLLDGDGSIVGDVWLFNILPSPITPEWTRKIRDPFMNPSSYCKSPLPFKMPESVFEFEVEWSLEENFGAKIKLDGQLIAWLSNGEKPGKSVSALRDGPLAKVLE